MKPSKFRALKMDFSRGSALQAPLWNRLMQSPHARALDEAAPVKRSLRPSARVLAFSLIAALLLSCAALAAMKTFSLGPYATYAQWDDQAVRTTVEKYVSDNRAVWEGRLYDRDGQPIQDLTDYLWPYTRDGALYELYTQDGQPCYLYNADGQMTIVGPDDPRFHAYIYSTWYDQLSDVVPYLHEGLVPTLPTAVPKGYHLESFSLPTDEEGAPYPQSKQLDVTYTNGHSYIHLTLTLMDRDTAFESVTKENLERLSIGANSAVCVGDDTLIMLVGDILYTFQAWNSFVTMDDLIMMARSV